MLYLVVTILGISFTQAQDFCAWGRAAAPINNNNGETFNWINGEYFRDQSVPSGQSKQTALWQGMPYYKSTNGDSCFQSTLWLYRYTNSQVYPPEFSWVIAASLGTLPINGYAYCGPEETPSISDLKSPVLCNGNWKVGKPEDAINNQDAAQATDVFFKVTAGGCPQVNCDQVRFCTNNNEEWASDETIDGFTCTTYNYLGTPNFYYATSQYSETGRYNLFFNPNVWMWAISESIVDSLDPDKCELYKNSKGFTAVANVNEGNEDTGEDPWYLAVPIDGHNVDWFDDLTTSATRILECIGNLSTPSPVGTVAPIPTSPPTDLDLCGSLVPNIGGLNGGATIPAEWGCGTPSPVDNSIDTPDPTSLPTIESPTAGVTTTSSPTTRSPTTGFPTQTAPPVATPATPPAQVGTIPPTRTNFPTTSAENGVPRPTFPTLSPGFNAPVYIPARYPNTKEPTSSPTYTFDSCVSNVELFDGLGSLQIRYNSANEKVEITIQGPADKWFGVGFGTKFMVNAYAIITSGIDINVEERLLYTHNKGYAITPSTFEYITTEEIAGNRIVSLIRDYSVITPSNDVYDFTDFIQCNNNKRSIDIIEAYGSDTTFQKHTNKNVDSIFGCNCADTKEPTNDPSPSPTSSTTVQGTGSTQDNTSIAVIDFYPLSLVSILVVINFVFA